MDKKERRIIIEDMLKHCLFSEYLPEEFSTEMLQYKHINLSNNEYAEPIFFTMDKYNDNNSRRFIAIPDVFSFIQAVNSFNDPIFDRIIEKNKNDDNTFSKIIDSEKKIKKFELEYGFETIIEEKKKVSIINDFIDNLDVKLKKSESSVCILHLDISSYFDSFYTHNITTLLSGSEWANEQYLLDKKGEKSKLEEEYRVLACIDSNFMNMNRRRTHGLLMGPRISFIVAESLLTRIDLELNEELNGIKFVRYMDDYDIFIEDEASIEKVIKVFNNVLHRYGLLLNDLKTKVEFFPYYTYMDFKSLSTEGKLSNLYGRFGQIEKSKDQNGAMLYFCENVIKSSTDYELALSLSLSILRNSSKAIKSSCKNIIRFTNDANRDNTIKALLKILNNYLERNYDLESIWVLYTLLKINPNAEIKEEMLEKFNELALVVYYYESSTPNIEYIKSLIDKKNWLINYELFFNNEINGDAYLSNIHLKEMGPYGNLKNQGIHFYNKKKAISRVLVSASKQVS